MKRKTTYKNKKKYQGGNGATVYPLQYYKADMPAPAAEPGSDLLKASLPNIVRPRIGGKRKTIRKRKAQNGGFVPSVMNGFLTAAQKYIVPIALFAGYKFMTKKGKKSRRYTRKH